MVSLFRILGQDRRNGPTVADDKEKPESGAGKAKPLKIKAKDNPWYLLATLYGVPKRVDDEVYAGELGYEDELQARNRVTGNRYCAARLDDKRRAQLIEEKRHSAEELTPFVPEGLPDVEEAFTKRCKDSAKALALPALADCIKRGEDSAVSIVGRFVGDVSQIISAKRPGHMARKLALAAYAVSSAMIAPLSRSSAAHRARSRVNAAAAADEGVSHI